MSKKIVVVEDNTDVRENIVELLELSGYEVFSAENGKVGAPLIIEKQPNLVVCDIMMPELDGFGVLKIIQSNPTTKHIPFIFLSAKSDKKDFRQGMNLGADDYITKPYEEVQLLEAIEMRLKKSKEGNQSNVSAILEEFYDEKKAIQAIREIFLEEEPQQLSKRETVFKVSSMPQHVYWVESGVVKTFQINEEGKELINGLYKTSDLIGLQDVFLGNKFHEGAVAIDDVILRRISKKDLFSLIAANGDVALFIYKKMSAGLAHRKSRLVKMAYDSVRMRTAYALVWLDEVYNVNKTYPAKILFSRDDLAAMVGTAKESLIRNLSTFKDEGLIDTDYSFIIIKDIEALVKCSL